MRTLLKTLTTAPGSSGRENAVADSFSALLMPYCEKIERDPLGNVIAMRRDFKPSRKTLMLEAHTDKIGLMVRHITKDGFLLVAPVGGFDTKILPASAVRIYGKQVLHGVICAIPPHIAKNDKAPDMQILCVDTGLAAEKVAALIKIGDIMEFETEFTPLGSSMAAASAMDDRAGLAVIIRTLELLQKTDLPFNIAAVGAVQEEVGMRGAGTAAYRVNPFAAVCIDVCHGQTPDGGSRDTFPMGKGPVITIGPNVQRAVSDRFIFTARSQNIPHQIDVDSGCTGTDAWVVQVARRGVYTGLLSLPLRYMHTGYEVLHLEDAENTAKLLAAVIKDIGKEDTLCF
ncbi:MAG: M42 family metallopeptidase [Ruminococcaceae bacterium]|nr:M42 family metallopeptidase [Oscillospiraceae bacterium]